jgi:hypothetical protein
MDAKYITDRFLDPDDYELLGLAVCSGYKACYEVIKSNPALGDFQPGSLQWSWLIRTFVEFAIIKAEIPELFETIKPYVGKNGLFTEFNKNGLRMTAHFMGGGKSKRKQMRKAVCRAYLAQMNGDLFATENIQPDAVIGFGHCLIQHSGYSMMPEAALLSVPDRNQIVSLTPFPLPLIEPKGAKIEEIIDDIRLPIVGANNRAKQQDN